MTVESIADGSNSAARASDYRVEFPGFSDMPAIPAGFVDVSWRNDLCPSFLNEAAGIILFVDFADPAYRECSETPRFSASRWDCGNTGIVLFETDDWAVVEASLPNFDLRLQVVAKVRRALDEEVVNLDGSGEAVAADALREYRATADEESLLRFVRMINS
jgi:hypothetical protein